MADIRILKAVEFNKLSAKFKKQYKDEQALFDAGWWLQPKYDGCYAEFHIDTRGVPTCRANTRTDEPIVSCQHILDTLIALTPLGSQCVYVGELWCDKPEVKFPEISGWVRRHYAAPDLCFKAFDMLPPGLETTELYMHRWTHLATTLPSQMVVDNWTGLPTSAKGYAADLKATGKYDGAILRDPNAGYKIGLVKNGEIVKVKPVLSLDLRMTALFVDRGEKTGREVYSIEVEYKGVRSKVGSGMTHDIGAVPRVGQIVEVECMGLTEDGKLREPRFKGIRFDKDKPD